MVYVMMGISGSGKTVTGKALAERLSLPFYDGDDFHPEDNIRKMAAGTPLTDADREPWLRALAGKIREWNAGGGAVLACSALKERYRRTLQTGGATRFILLEAPKEEIAGRLSRRTGHFMPASLLESQLADLDIPADAIRADTALDVAATLAQILDALR